MKDSAAITKERYQVEKRPQISGRAVCPLSPNNISGLGVMVEGTNLPDFSSIYNLHCKTTNNIYWFLKKNLIWLWSKDQMNWFTDIHYATISPFSYL